MKKFNLFILGMVFALFLTLVSIPAGATPILDFGISAPTPGTISYAGGSNPLVGTGIAVDVVWGGDTRLNNDVTLEIVGGVLSFSTGNLTSSDPSTWNFGGGGFITITGGVNLDADDDLEILPGTALLSGTFYGASVDSFNGDFRIAGASFFNSIYQGLLDFYGLPVFGPDGSPENYGGNFNISFQATGGSPNAFSSNRVLSGDVTSSVPEPATMLLLGSGLVGMGFFVRRKLKK